MKGLSQSGFTENVTKFSSSPNQKLLQEKILEMTQFVSWYITIFCVMKTLLGKILFEIHQKSKQLEVGHSYIPIISMIPCLFMQNIVCPSYLYCHCHKRGSLWNSGKSSQSTNWMVNTAIEISRSIKLIQIPELVSITGIRTAEFNQKWK